MDDRIRDKLTGTQDRSEKGVTLDPPIRQRGAYELARETNLARSRGDNVGGHTSAGWNRFRGQRADREGVAGLRSAQLFPESLAETAEQVQLRSVEGLGHCVKEDETAEDLTG